MFQMVSFLIYGSGFGQGSNSALNDVFAFSLKRIDPTLPSHFQKQKTNNEMVPKNKVISACPDKMAAKTDWYRSISIFKRKSSL